MGSSMTAYMPQSVTDDWSTPIDLFQQLDAQHDFDIDVVAIKYCKVDILECLEHSQIIEIEGEIYRHHNDLMSGQADI